jgi:hypothetical protein
LTVNTDFMTIGGNSGASGTANVSGNSTISTPSLAVGRFGEQATGHLKLEGSSISLNTGLFEVAVDDLNDFASDGVFKRDDSTGTVEFIADAGGVSPVVASGDVHLNDGSVIGSANLVVDMSAAPTGDLLLVDVGGTLHGEFAGLSEGASVPNRGCLREPRSV